MGDIPKTTPDVRRQYLFVVVFLADINECDRTPLADVIKSKAFESLRKLALKTLVLTWRAIFL